MIISKHAGYEAGKCVKISCKKRWLLKWRCPLEGFVFCTTHIQGDPKFASPSRAENKKELYGNDDFCAVDAKRGRCLFQIILIKILHIYPVNFDRLLFINYLLLLLGKAFANPTNRVRYMTDFIFLITDPSKFLYFFDTSWFLTMWNRFLFLYHTQCNESSTCLHRWNNLFDQNFLIF